ncbi:hypothetical protein LCGC14_1423710 [marine sediment metagenome]|uniref:Uncharacterized protein n=1 Tax=marine sediment metagenome TaxID=412755 RepID=A0A0F9JR16_9ZZZZ
MEIAPAKSLGSLLEHVRTGGRLGVFTYLRSTIIDAKVLRRFEKQGEWLLREEGDGYRLRAGRGSVYLLPGQLKLITD